MGEPGVSVDVAFSVAVEERADWPLDGTDTLIAKFTQPVLAAKETLVEWALAICEQAALNLGTHLHHADFVLTSNPHTVRERGIMPEHQDCPDCRAGLTDALADLVEQPKLVLAVGQVYWSPYPPETADG